MSILTHIFHGHRPHWRTRRNVLRLHDSVDTALSLAEIVRMQVGGAAELAAKVKEEFSFKSDAYFPLPAGASAGQGRDAREKRQRM
jgi:hypothetical protein|eukprot:COSAG06_NODE_5308_length_3571_cov_21.023906_4_plen_86_part_00